MLLFWKHDVIEFSTALVSHFFSFTWRLALYTVVYLNPGVYLVTSLQGDFRMYPKMLHLLYTLISVVNMVLWVCEQTELSLKSMVMNGFKVNEWILEFMESYASYGWVCGTEQYINTNSIKYIFWILIRLAFNCVIYLSTQVDIKGILKETPGQCNVLSLACCKSTRSLQASPQLSAVKTPTLTTNIWLPPSLLRPLKL